MGNSVRLFFKSGNHWPINPLWSPAIWVFRKPKELVYTVTFDKSCIYQLPDNYDQWNKLIGIDLSPLTPGNHGPSVFIVWRWKNAALELAAYWNNKSADFFYQPLLRIENHDFNTAPYLPVFAAIAFSNNSVLFEVEVKAQRKSYALSGIKSAAPAREISPYFGGKYSAPHTISFTYQKH